VGAEERCCPAAWPDLSQDLLGWAEVPLLLLLPANLLLCKDEDLAVCMLTHDNWLTYITAKVQLAGQAVAAAAGVCAERLDQWSCSWQASRRPGKRWRCCEMDNEWDRRPEKGISGEGH
jgi:hypothetical protein